MSPLELGHVVLLVVSFLLSAIVLVVLALILEALMFALGRGGGSDEYNGR